MKCSSLLVIIGYERKQERWRLFDEIISESEPEPENDDNLADDIKVCGFKEISQNN